MASSETLHLLVLSLLLQKSQQAAHWIPCPGPVSQMAMGMLHVLKIFWYKVISFFLAFASVPTTCYAFQTWQHQNSFGIKLDNRRNRSELLLKEGRTKWPSPAKTEIIRNFAVKFTVSQFCGRITSLYANLIGWNQYLSQEASYINSELGFELYASENP